MSLSVQDSISNEGWDTYSESKDFKFSINPGFCFKGIPPERMGLDGEYDHYGLAKRVAYSFHMRYAAVQLRELQVTQRGRVVVLSGQVSSRNVLTQLVNIALSVTGTLAVETCGIRLEDEGQEWEEFRLQVIQL